MRAAVKRLSLAADRFLPAPAGVTTLIYHRVDGGTDSSVDLPANVFERQIEWLASHARVVTLSEAVAAVRSDDHSIEGAVVVTFDDGTIDFCESAVPILVRHGVPATLYAETAPISSGAPNAAGLSPTTWNALRDAVATGLVAIESHTHTHRVLRHADAATAADDLDRSIDTIASEIGAGPRHFAYPKAELGSGPARGEVARRFESAAVGGGRVTEVGGDVYKWTRHPIQCTDTFEMFVRKVRGGMRLEGFARSAVARIRYRTTDY